MVARPERILYSPPCEGGVGGVATVKLKSSALRPRVGPEVTPPTRVIRPARRSASGHDLSSGLLDAAAELLKRHVVDARVRHPQASWPPSRPGGPDLTWTLAPFSTLGLPWKFGLPDGSCGLAVGIVVPVAGVPGGDTGVACPMIVPVRRWCGAPR